MNKPIRVLVLIVFLGLVGSPELLIAQTPPSGPPPGILVDIGGHKLHIHCIGPTNAALTVVFESGGGGSSKDWSRVRELLPAQVRTCAYDRAGSGWSEAGPSPRTMRQEVFELLKSSGFTAAALFTLGLGIITLSLGDADSGVAATGERPGTGASRGGPGPGTDSFVGAKAGDEIEVGGVPALLVSAWPVPEGQPAQRTGTSPAVQR